VNALTKYKDAPLHFAVAQGDARMVALLVKSGARADIENDDGDTPVDIAKKMGRTEILAELAKAST
jgi:ankyrin repeat protein